MHLVKLAFGIWSLVFGLWPCESLRPKTQDLRPRLPLQQINLVDPDRLLVPVERDNNAEANRGFCGGHYNHENCKDLSCHCIGIAGFLKVTRKRDEIEIGSIQNQLNR